MMMCDKKNIEHVSSLFFSDLSLRFGHNHRFSQTKREKDPVEEHFGFTCMIICFTHIILFLTFSIIISTTTINKNLIRKIKWCVWKIIQNSILSLFSFMVQYPKRHKPQLKRCCFIIRSVLLFGGCLYLNETMWL